MKGFYLSLSARAAWWELRLALGLRPALVLGIAAAMLHGPGLALGFWRA